MHVSLHLDTSNIQWSSLSNEASALTCPSFLFLPPQRIIQHLTGNQELEPASIGQSDAAQPVFFRPSSLYVPPSMHILLA